jgi:hypothetical protein
MISFIATPFATLFERGHRSARGKPHLQIEEIEVGRAHDGRSRHRPVALTACRTAQLRARSSDLAA